MQADAKTCRGGDRGRRGGRSCRRTRRRREAASRRFPAGHTARRSSRRWRSRRRPRPQRGARRWPPRWCRSPLEASRPTSADAHGRAAKSDPPKRSGQTSTAGGIERERRCAVRLGQVRSPCVRQADEEGGRPHAVPLERGHPMKRDARHDRGCGTKDRFARHVRTEASSRRLRRTGAAARAIPRSRAALVL